MKRLSLAALALASLPLAGYAVFGDQPAGQSAGQSSGQPAGQNAAQPRHVLLTPDQLPWKDGPPSLPPGCKYVVLEGDPSQPGFFAMRAQFPDGYKIPPHWHPGHERVTVISGTFHLGMGERFDRDAAKSFPAGSYLSMEPGMRHFAWAEGPTVVQIATLGPWDITYVNSSDDPRQQQSTRQQQSK